MERSTKLFSAALVLCVVVMAHQTAAQELKGKNLINKVCTITPSRDLCVGILSSDPIRSPDADLKDLAVISLRVAARNASGILSEAKMLIDDDNLDPDVQQGLSDCKETILDAESQLEDTIASYRHTDLAQGCLGRHRHLRRFHSRRRRRSLRQECHVPQAVQHCHCHHQALEQTS
ncbi:hypothetical protein glysoja_002083 [Glycine soja]|nr:hypothetical protein glysoja_002083 [Glycine soja]